MHWVTRNGRRYAYQSTWANGRCVKKYLGTEAEAKARSQQEQQARLDRQRQQGHDLLQETRVQAAKELLQTLSQQTRLLQQAVLLVAGWHQHHRQWRRRRQVNEQ